MYLYELHCHTQETSKCGKISGRDLADFYHRAGYTGMIVTDHFFNGNTTVSKRLPWEEKVGLFQEGYRAAKQRGDELGLDVFFGWEFSYLGTDFLTYGLGADWLLRYPYCDQLAVSDYCRLVRQSGGIIVHAHPFREAAHIEMIRLLPRGVDAVETVNACRDDFTNLQADRYADIYGLPKSIGTDNHVGFRAQIAAAELPYRAKDSADILRSVIAGEYKMHLYRLEGDASDFTMTERPLPAEVSAE